MIAEEREDVVMPPALVPELEDVPMVWWQDFQELGQTRIVSRKGGRQLVEDRTEMVGERLDPIAEQFERVGSIVKAPVVRDEAARFDAEAEACRSGGLPRLYGAFRGEPVEAVIQLDGIELLGVVVEPAGLGDVARKEIALPVLVAPPGAADTNVHRHHCPMPRQ